MKGSLLSDMNQKLYPCEEERNFPLDGKNHEVLVNYIEPDGSLWVMLNSDMDGLNSVSDEINENVPVSESIDLCGKKVYAVLHEDTAWYRARILRIAANVLVRFIDFGDTAVVAKSRIAPLRESLSIYPPFAMKVALSPESILLPSVGQTMVLFPLFRKEDLTVVEVANESEYLLSNEVESLSSDQGSIIVDVTSETVVSGKLAPEISSMPADEGECKTLQASEAKVEIVMNSNESHSSELTYNERKDEESRNLPKDSSSCLSSVRPAVGALSPVLDSHVICVSSIVSEDSSEIKSLSNMMEEMMDKSDNLSAPKAGRNISSDAICGEGKAVGGPKEVPYPAEEKASNTAMPDLKFNEIMTLEKMLAISVQESNHECDSPSSEGGFPTKLISDSGKNEKDADGKAECSQYDTFISALGRYPHLGGGYGPSQAEESCDNKGIHFDKNLTEEKVKSTHSASFRGSTNQETFHSKTRPQHGIMPPRHQNSFNHSRPTFSKNMPSGSTKPVHHIGGSANATFDYKHMLDFELSIIREQNRLQLLQIQRKMDERYSELSKQVSGLRDDVTRQLAAFRNEVNSKLLMMNDALVEKVASFYTDLDTIKNDLEIKQGLPESCGGKGTLSEEPQLSEVLKEQLLYPNLNSLQTCCQNEGAPLKSNDNSFTIPANNHQLVKQNQSQDGVAPNRLMSLRLEKMAERDYSKEGKQPHQPLNNTTTAYQNGKMVDQQAEMFKVDYIESQKNGSLDVQSSAKNGTIICASNLDAESINPDILCNLFGVYGNVQRIKISLQDKGKAYIEMADAAQAELAMQYFDGVRFRGRAIRVTPSPFSQLKLTKQEFQSNTCKDFTKPALQRFNRFKYGSWNRQKLHAPSDTLLIMNILKSVSEDKIKDEFSKNGFRILSIVFPNSSSDKKMAFVSFGSVEEAVNALSVMHQKELSDWMHMKISFARGERKFSENNQM